MPIVLVCLAACFPPAEGLPPPPGSLASPARASVAPAAAFPSRAPEAAAAPVVDAGAPAYVVPPEAPSTEARVLLTHVTRAASSGDRRTLRQLTLPACAEASCSKLFAMEREVLVADAEPTVGEGTRAYALVSRVCDDRPCGTLALLFTRDCSLQSTPFRVAEIREGRRGLDAWLAEGKAPCPAGPRRPVAPSPFDPSGTPYPVQR